MGPARKVRGLPAILRAELSRSRRKDSKSAGAGAGVSGLAKRPTAPLTQPYDLLATWQQAGLAAGRVVYRGIFAVLMEQLACVRSTADENPPPCGPSIERAIS